MLGLPVVTHEEIGLLGGTSCVHCLDVLVHHAQWHCAVFPNLLVTFEYLTSAA